jgi:putative ABC transport system permease protein
VFGPFLSPMRRVTKARVNLYGVVVQGQNAADQAVLQEVVRETMRRRHKLRPAQQDDFALESSQSALTQWMSIKKYLVLAGIVLPAIGLVVGAIVIMNIMLVAVAERTREIGIRIALGAVPRDILGLVLSQGVRLAVVGIAVGLLGALAASRLLAGLLFQVEPTDTATFAGTAVALALVAVAASLLPAARAVRTDPVDALRRE